MEQIFIWTFSDMLSLGLGTLLAIAGILALVIEWFAQKKCKHDDGVNETSACNAICRKCGKNLGFIGNWRKSHVD